MIREIPRSGEAFLSYLSLLVLAICLWLPGLYSLPVIDRDEAHFAQATRQMLQTGNFFQIRYQDTTRFQKPPGINWLQAVSVRYLSNAEAPSIGPYRLPSFLGALFSVWLLYFFTRRLFPQKTAWYASALLSTTLLMSIETHMAVIDTSLLVSVLLMQIGLGVIYLNRQARELHLGWAALFWLGLAYGFLLKGVTPLVGGLTMLALCFMGRDWRWVKRLHWGKGLLFFCLVTGYWLWRVGEAEHSNYLLQMLHRDLLPKLQGGHESHGQPPLFHLVLLPVTFWPASLFLWPAIIYSWQRRKDAVVQFLLAWILPTWIFFECMPTKLPQYVLPTFPALAILCAVSLFSEKTTWSIRWIHFWQAVWFIIALGILFAFSSLSYALVGEVSYGSYFFLLPVGFSLIAFWKAWKQKFVAAARWVLVIAISVYPWLFSETLPHLTPLWLSRSVATTLNALPPSSSPLWVVDYAEPSLVFYLNTHRVVFTDQQAAIHELSEAKRTYVLLDKKNLAMMTQSKIPYRIVTEITGFNYSKGRWMTLILLTNGDRP